MYFEVTNKSVRAFSDLGIYKISSLLKERIIFCTFYRHLPMEDAFASYSLRTWPTTSGNRWRLEDIKLWVFEWASTRSKVLYILLHYWDLEVESEGLLYNANETIENQPSPGTSNVGRSIDIQSPRDRKHQGRRVWFGLDLLCKGILHKKIYQSLDFDERSGSIMNIKFSEIHNPLCQLSWGIKPL